MGSSPLLELPAELRNRIYELALRQPDGIRVNVKDPKPRASNTLIGLTTFAANDFILVTKWFNDMHPGELEGTAPGILSRTLDALTWLIKVGTHNATNAKSISVDLGVWDDFLDYAVERPYGIVGPEGLLRLAGCTHVQFQLAVGEWDTTQERMHEMFRLSYRLPYAASTEDTGEFLSGVQKEGEAKLAACDLPQRVRDEFGQDHRRICQDLLGDGVDGQ